ncbi:hypothetical protein MLD38_038705 [Melastoma candidum]|uniref:Uncharacterized protein n=1 Tax=Melastoma candidum TaxID=119954 RepID=A0ACB9L0H6_9MYRT|nr:hypothetical protein MLD38_038705 [Melastoma candidum]
MSHFQLLLFVNGKVVNGNDEVCYNKGPFKIKVDVDVDYVTMGRVITRAMKVSEVSRLEICHKYPITSYGESGVKFILVLIGDDDVLRLLVEFGISNPNYIQEICISSSRGNSLIEARASKNIAPELPVIAPQRELLTEVSRRRSMEERNIGVGCASCNDFTAGGSSVRDDVDEES